MSDLEKQQMRQEVLAEMRSILMGLHQQGRHTLILSDYEVANLRAAIHAVGYGAVGGDTSPLGVLNTGDWLGQIFNRLPEVDLKPNAEADELRERARQWKSTGKLNKGK